MSHLLLFTRLVRFTVWLSVGETYFQPWQRIYVLVLVIGHLISELLQYVQQSINIPRFIFFCFWYKWSAFSITLKLRFAVMLHSHCITWIKGIVYPQNEITVIVYCILFCRLWNTKGEVLKNVDAALFHTKKQKGYGGTMAIKLQKGQKSIIKVS